MFILFCFCFNVIFSLLYIFHKNQGSITLCATKIQVRPEIKGLKTSVVDRYLSKPKSNSDSYINLLLGKKKKVKFRIKAYYGKNVSEVRVITK